MTSFDLLIIGFLAISIGFAAYRGAIREFLTLIAVILAGLIAWASLKPLMGMIGKPDSFVAMALVGTVVAVAAFVAVYVGLAALAGRIRLKNRAQLADRIGGGAYGLLRGVVLLGLGFLAYGYYLDEANRPAAVNDAVLLPFAEASARLIEGFAPTTPSNTAEPALEPTASAGAEGYAQGARSGLDEMVATVTTTDDGPSRETARAASSADPIAVLIAQPQDDADTASPQ